MKKKVLMIAHQFPPMGGPGSFRSLQLARHLSEYGYEPIILTITEKDIEDCHYPFDLSLLDPEDEFSVYRVSTGEPRMLKRLLMKARVYRLAWFFFYPFFWEASALWPVKAYCVAKKLIMSKKISVIYTSSGPYSAILLGYLLKRRLNVTWVADLRDPFTDSYAWQWPSKVHWYFSRWLERVLLKYPNRLVVNTPEVEKLYLRRGVVSSERLTHITNGFG